MLFTMETYKITLLPQSPILITDDGDLTRPLPHIPSDTLYSALFLLAQEQGKGERLFPENEPIFRISSAFPGKKGEFFFPPPFHLPKRQNGAFRKKDLPPWIGVEDLKKLLDKSPMEFSKDPIEKQSIPAISVDRSQSSPPDLFFRSAYRLGKDWGYTFLLRIQEELLPEIHALLTLLGEEGIGGERSLGYGYFSVSKPQPFPWDIKGSRGLLLSRFLPRNDEMAILRESYYQLTWVRGYLSGNLPYRRPILWLFQEGSIFPKKDLRGRRVDLTVQPLPHPVYRFCYPFLVDYPDWEEEDAEA